MPLVEVREVPEDESVSQTVGGVRTHVRGFRIFFTHGTGERPIHAFFAVSLKVGEKHPADPLARVENIGPFQLEHAVYNHPDIDVPCTTFRGTVTYSTARATEFENPTDRPPSRNWSTTTTEVDRLRAFKDDGTMKPTKNAAGDPILGLTEPIYTWVFTYSKNIETKDWHPELWKGWLNRTNETEWNDLDPNTIKLIDVSFAEAEDSIVDNKILKWGSINLAFHICMDVDFDDEGQPIEGTWKRKVLNAGLNYLQDEQRYPIHVNGVEVTTPHPLTAEGGILDQEDEFVFLEFQTAQQKDFTNLPLAGVTLK